MEIFDIYDEHMNPIGTATRSDVHKYGYWHQTFHCWLVRTEGHRRMLRFQRRHSSKDTYPSLFDITVAGHLAAGETIADAVREIEEELGIAPHFEDLVKLGEYREESTAEANGIPFIDRELSHVFGWQCDVPLGSLKMQPEEVTGVYEADLEEMIALFRGGLAEITAAGIEPDRGGQPFPVTRRVRVSDFVPRELSYYTGMFEALRSLG
ncbi:NUDIX domain-containing protein [Paenibacillus tarimensis]